MANTATVIDTSCPDCMAEPGEPHWPGCVVHRGGVAVNVSVSIALDPRFAARSVELFEEYARNYGRDIAGFAWAMAAVAARKES